MASALVGACADSGIDVCDGVDLLAISPPLAWGYDDLAATLSVHAHCPVQDSVVALPGGNAPVDLLLRAVAAIQSGRVRTAAVVGGESMYSRRRARKEGVTLPWTPFTGHRDLVGDQRPLTNELEERHGLRAPRQLFPLLENALRHELGRTVTDHQRIIAGILSRNSDVAARNSHAWFPRLRTVEELLDASEENRMICFPYPRLMNAVMEVDMAGAVVVMSEKEANHRQIPLSARTVVEAGAACLDAWTVTERPSLTSSPAMDAIAASLWAASGRTADDIAHWDLYSCFPVAVQMAAHSFGIDLQTHRPPTVTGGLAYAGGPGNSYAIHSLATMHRVVSGTGDRGVVTALGNIAGKHAAVLLAGSGVESVTASPAHLAIPTTGPELVDAPEGPGVIETYTVEYDREGGVERAPVVVGLPGNRRTLALMDPTPENVTALVDADPMGRSVYLQPGADGGPNSARFT